MVSSVTGTAVTGVTAGPTGIDTLYTHIGLQNTPLFIKNRPMAKGEKQTLSLVFLYNHDYTFSLSGPPWDLNQKQIQLHAH